jgi:hypothetical protein
MPKPPRDPPQPQPQQHLQTNVTHKPGQLPQNPHPINPPRPPNREPSQRPTPIHIRIPRPKQHLGHSPQSNPDRREAVVNQNLPTSRHMRRPPQIVHISPVVMLTVDVQQIKGPRPRATQPSRVPDDQLHNVREPSRSDVRQEAVPSGGTPKQPPINKGVNSNHPSTNSTSSMTENDRRPPLMTADLHDSSPRRQPTNGIPQHASLSLGQPPGHISNRRPCRVKLGSHTT